MLNLYWSTIYLKDGKNHVIYHCLEMAGSGGGLKVTAQAQPEPQTHNRAPDSQHRHNPSPDSQHRHNSSRSLEKIIHYTCIIVNNA